MPNWEQYDITMRHSLYYLKTNEWHKHQKHIAIIKEIDICTARFKLKESKKAYKHSSTGQASTTAKRAAIIKQKMADCKKAYRKFLIHLPLILGQIILTTLCFHISRGLNWQNAGFLSNRH